MATGCLAASLVIVVSSGLVWAAQISLAWDANTEPDLAGYWLYVGDSPNTLQRQPQMIPVGINAAHYEVVEGMIYYFSLTAENLKGYESGRSNVVRYPSYPFQTYLPAVFK